MQTQSPAVSIVIPAFNEEKRLRESVQRIRHACSATPDIAAACEVIVCDNNSTDAIAAVAGQSGCRVVFERVNQISRARNPENAMTRSSDGARIDLLASVPREHDGVNPAIARRRRASVAAVREAH